MKSFKTVTLNTSNVNQHNILKKNEMKRIKAGQFFCNMYNREGDIFMYMLCSWGSDLEECVTNCNKWYEDSDEYCDCIDI